MNTVEAGSNWATMRNRLVLSAPHNPLSPPIIADVGLAYAFREDFDAAAMYCRRALSLEPNFHRSYWFLGLAAAWSGSARAAEEALEPRPAHFGVGPMTGVACARGEELLAARGHGLARAHAG